LATVTVLLLCAPTACAPTPPPAAAQAADFGFRFEFGPCFVPSVEFPNGATERLDTFNGVYTKNLGGVSARIVRAPISLTADQMGAIHNTIANIRFLDYPARFVGVRPGAQVITAMSAPIYSLEVRMDGATHIVTWSDESEPSSVEADRLRNLFSMMLGFIHEHPEFKRLPPDAIVCK
jgi:hypothetical protein